jgi:hypothetical protein
VYAISSGPGAPAIPIRECAIQDREPFTSCPKRDWLQFPTHSSDGVIFPDAIIDHAGL